MAQGLERRSAAETNSDRSLRSMAEIKPVSLPRGAGPASAPRAPRAQVTGSISKSIRDGLGNFAQDQLGKAAQRKHEASLMDGAMAAQQGKTFDEVEMGGDKWALEGYRVVNAQRMSSSLLTSQRAEIAEGGFEMTPEEYRAHFMNRAEGVLNGVDERTGQLVKEQLLKQMPVLVDDHMVQHLEHKEKQNFEALEASVDTISLDPTAGDTLLAFADGSGGSPTAGLSEDRRRQAVTSGLIRAFENNNPAAYAVLSGNGRLKELPVAQRRQIEGAKRAFEQRNRQELNVEFLESERELMEGITSGDLPPQAAVEAYVDLLASHNITATQQEAGAIYDTAQTGIRQQKVTTGLLIDNAALRGDRGTEVDLILGSLTGTESGGNAQANRTNLDGREFSGLIQMGDARLSEYNAATGSNLTAATFKNMTADQQKNVNRWHVNDIINHLEAKGHDKLVGTKINGVTVTRSGLVAVAHLGGKGGMDKFVRTKGQYNPKDQLGTSLTDYLGKHATGNVTEFMSPAQQQQAAQNRMKVLRERAAIDTYENMQPELNAAADEYKNGGSREEYLQKTQAIRQEYNVAKTMADAKADMSLMEDMRKAAADQLDEANAFNVGIKTREAQAKFDAVIEAFEGGTASEDDVLTARNLLNKERQAIQEDHGVQFDASAELTQVDAQTTAITDAVKKRIETEAETGLINGAVASGTLDELSPAQQQKAVENKRKLVLNEVRDAVSAKGLNEDQAGELFDARMLDFYAQSGMVDPNLRRVMNGFFEQGMLDAKGDPSPSYVEAATQYRNLRARNAGLADKYVEPGHRNHLEAILEMASGGPLEGAIATMGRREASFPRNQSTEAFMMSPDTQSAIASSVDKYLRTEDIGVAQGLFSSTADIQQARNRSWFDRFGVTDEANVQVIGSRMETELSKAHRLTPYVKPQELVRSTAERVKAHTPIIGGIAVTLPMDGATAGEMFFGARAADFTDQDGVINDAVMDFFRTPEFREQYPFVNETTFQEGLPEFVPDTISAFGMEVNIRGNAGTPGDKIQTMFTGVRPFQTTFDTNSGKMMVLFSLPSGGSAEPIVIDTRKIGQEYMRKHTVGAAQ